MKKKNIEKKTNKQTNKKTKKGEYSKYSANPNLKSFLCTGSTVFVWVEQQCQRAIRFADVGCFCSGSHSQYLV